MALTPYDANLTVGCFTLSQTGLAIEGQPTYDDWHHFGVQLGQLERTIQLAIGDWINYGEQRWGEKYAQAMEDTGLAYSTLSKYCFVANTFSHDNRNFSPRASIDRWTHLKYLAEVANVDHVINRDLIDFGVTMYLDCKEQGIELPAAKFRRLLMIERDGRGNGDDPVYEELYTLYEETQSDTGLRDRQYLMGQIIQAVRKRLPTAYIDLIDDILAVSNTF